MLLTYLCLVSRLNYPELIKTDVVDTYHGYEIADPYRFLEDSNDAQSSEWIASQKALTESYLSSLPERDEIRSRIEELSSFPTSSPPHLAGDHLFCLKNDGRQNQSALYVDDRLFFDPNTLSEEGLVAISFYEPSLDGRYLAIALAKSGSDWITIHLYDVETGEELSETISWVKFSSIAWDCKGFFYSRYAPATEKEERLSGRTLCYHKVGTDPENDPIIFSDSDEISTARTFDNGRYLTIISQRGCDLSGPVYIKDLYNHEQGFKLLFPNDGTHNIIVEITGNSLYLHTNKEAPLYRLVKVDLQTNEWTDIIPESENQLSSISAAGSFFIARHLKDGSSRLNQYDRRGHLIGGIDLPEIGTVTAIEGSKKSDDLYFTFDSVLTPPTLYKYNLTERSLNATKSELPFETTLHFCEGKDGAKIPLYITKLKGDQGPAPTLLYAYGGFGISITPRYTPQALHLLEKGGVYVKACLRGGGEYGEPWHNAGRLHNKQTTFDDFFAVAEYLIKEGYTTSDKLAIKGGSNGGLLVTASITQRPDLFGAAIAKVPVTDMLRFQNFTIGWAWGTEYGLSDDPDYFETLYSYSPLHNVKQATYPPTLITTGDHDDRVVPSHAYKFTATLQEMQQGKNPVLLRIDTDAGHGAGKPRSKNIEEMADELAFILQNLGENEGESGSD